MSFYFSLKVADQVVDHLQKKRFEEHLGKNTITTKLNILYIVEF